MTMLDSINKLIDLDRSKRLNIAVIGDSMRDIYVHGRFESCQENCPKFVETSRVSVPGGAANAARQLANWNARSWLISITGFPGCDKHVWSLNHEYENELTFQTGEVPVKERFLIDGKISFRHDDEHHDYRMKESELKCCRNLALKAIKEKQFDGVLISDYDKGFMDDRLIRDIIDECHVKKIPVVFDAKRHWTNRYHTYDVTLKCNRAYGDTHLFNTEMSIKYVITHGSLTPTVHSRMHHNNGREPCRSINCLNHVGAGDSFSAHLILALAHGLSLEESASIGHAAGRCYVQCEHGSPPFLHEIRRDIEPLGGKLISANDLPRLRKSISGKLVFTNGIFRVPHAGHSWLMQWAREQGDCLVVGINTDESAKRFDRGFVLPLHERIDMLSAMSAVDYIVPFSEGTPMNVIEQLKPDILCKGYDSQNTLIPGSEVVPDVRLSPPSPYPNRHATTLIDEIKLHNG